MPTKPEDIMLHLVDPIRRAIGEKQIGIEGDIKQERSRAYGQYCGVLAEFDLTTIKAAAKFYVACTPKWWPSPAEIATKCRSMIAEAEYARRPKAPESRRGGVAMADNSMNSELGRQAAAEGWIAELWGHIRDKGEWPTATEIAALKLDSEKNRKAREEMLASGDPVRVDFATKANESRERLVRLANPEPEEATDA